MEDGLTKGNAMKKPIKRKPAPKGAKSDKC